MILKLTNKSKNFYAHLGKIFGSREVQRKTGDRFYDDDDKIWYLYYDRGVPNTFVSIKDNVIKNVWTENKEHLIKVLKQIFDECNIVESVVPSMFKEEYVQAGFSVQESSKKFVKIRGVENDEDKKE